MYTWNSRLVATACTVRNMPTLAVWFDHHNTSIILVTLFTFVALDTFEVGDHKAAGVQDGLPTVS